MEALKYDHTQRGKLHFIVHATAILVVALVLTNISEEDTNIAVYISAGTTAVLEFFAFTCVTLRVYDDEDCIALRFGPIPLLKKRIPYAEIKSGEPSRSKLVDGWGIHYIRKRGWIYNLWGFECVQLTTIDNRTIRIGTDDSAKLSAFLQTKISQSPQQHAE